MLELPSVQAELFCWQSRLGPGCLFRAEGARRTHKPEEPRWLIVRAVLPRSCQPGRGTLQERGERDNSVASVVSYPSQRRSAAPSGIGGLSRVS